MPVQPAVRGQVRAAWGRGRPGVAGGLGLRPALLSDGRGEEVAAEAGSAVWAGVSQGQLPENDTVVTQAKPLLSRTSCQVAVRTEMGTAQEQANPTHRPLARGASPCTPAFASRGASGRGRPCCGKGVWGSRSPQEGGRKGHLPRLSVPWGLAHGVRSDAK